MESSEVQLRARECGVSRQPFLGLAAVLALPRQAQSQIVVDWLEPIAIGHGVVGHREVVSLAVRAVALFSRQRRMGEPLIGLFVVVVLFDFLVKIVFINQVVGFG